MIEKINYKCRNCGFEWKSPQKEYDQCPDCNSENIYKIKIFEDSQKTVENPERRRQGLGRGGMGAGPPRACKCQKCGYETGKTPGVPCRNDKCPECGGQMCGAE
jgi:predicted Zn-ribbon and HTH transcriptional regulator